MAEIDYREICWSFMCEEAHWMVNKKLVQLLGLREAMMLADLMSKERYFARKGVLEKGGWFYNTQSNIEEDTGLSPYKQSKIIEALVDAKVLEVKRKGLPARQHFKVDHKRVVELAGSPVIKKLNKLNQSGLRTTSKGALRHNNNIVNKNKGEKEKKEKSPKGDMSARRRSAPPQPTSPINRRGDADEIVNSNSDPPPQCHELIDYWQSLGLPKMRVTDPPSKRYKRTVEDLASLLKGTFFNLCGDRSYFEYYGRAFGVDEIKRAMHEYHLAVFSNGHRPVEAKAKTALRKKPLCSFLYEYHSKECRSYFIKNLEEGAQPAFKRKDRHPNLTAALTNIYPAKSLTQAQRNKFIKAAEMLAEFHSLWVERFNNPIKLGEMPELLHKALLDYWGEQRLHPGNYCASNAEQILEDYLMKQNVVEDFEPTARSKSGAVVI